MANENDPLIPFKYCGDEEGVDVDGAGDATDKKELRRKNGKPFFLVACCCLATVVIAMLFKVSSPSSNSSLPKENLQQNLLHERNGHKQPQPLSGGRPEGRSIHSHRPPQRRPPQRRQVPTAYTTSGGGFKTMTASMGIIRAWYESNILLHNTTHFGCNSGGSWFQTQFSYSKEFYESAIGVTGETVAEFLSTWGAKYHDAMDTAVHTNQFEDIDYTIQTASSACPLYALGVDNITAADIINAGLETILDGSYFPANNWYYYINVMLSSYIPQSNTRLFSSRREGFPTGTIIVASTLGPDAYQFNPSLKTPKLTGLPQGVTLLPISYTVLEGEHGAWQFTAAINQTLEVSVRGNATAVNLGTALPPVSISDVAAASSSAVGVTGSPTLLKQIISDAVKLPRFGLSKKQQAAIKPIVNTCLPLGLQNLSSPTEGNEVSSVSSWSPLYRHIDGAYTDNTAITHTVANMQQGCINDPSKYDCTQGLRLLNVVDGWYVPQTGIGRLFANCECGTGAFDWIGTAIDPQIFAGEFSWNVSDPGWELYSNTTYPRETTLNPSISYAWRGNVTTVENAAFGVRGGMTVDLVLLFVAFPPASLIFPGYGANYAFSNIYSDIAQEQYAATLALFEKLNLADDWGTRLFQQASPSPTSFPTASRKTSKSSKSSKSE